MMPSPRPRAAEPRFDPRPAIAALEYDRTDMLRELHPDLSYVWDELDELRADTDNRVTVLEDILDVAVKRLEALHAEMEDADDNATELDEILSMIEDRRADL